MPGEPAEDRQIAVGKITSAHGIRGEVSVLVLSEVEHRFDPGSELLLADGRRLTVESSRPHRGGRLVKFAEVADRTEAQLLQGSYLLVPEADLGSPPEGAWWPHQLEGCHVVTESGRPLGRITEVVLAPANDLWVVTGEKDAEILIPALKEVVMEVDLDERRIVVRAIPGLTVPD